MGYTDSDEDLLYDPGPPRPIIATGAVYAVCGTVVVACLSGIAYFHPNAAISIAFMVFVAGMVWLNG